MLLQRLRVWVMAEDRLRGIYAARVVTYIDLPDQITAAKFTPDGQLAVGAFIPVYVHVHMVCACFFTCLLSCPKFQFGCTSYPFL